MNNWHIEDIKTYGFEGFHTIKYLRSNTDEIPLNYGVYMILKSTNKSNFLDIGTGGYFKKKNPNVATETLADNWIDNSIVLYIGKAGGTKIQSTLRSRLKLYFDFGLGKPVGHRGGRYIWQLKESDNLIVCWKELSNKNPREVEKELIQSYKRKFGDRPFANLMD